MGELKDVPVEKADRWELIGEVGQVDVEGKVDGCHLNLRFS